MLVNLIEVKTSEKEALKNFLKKIPLLSKVIQFNRGINDINLKSLRKNIGTILQDPFIFAKSIKDNIKLWRNEDGILIIGIQEFLLNKDSLDL